VAGFFFASAEEVFEVVLPVDFGAVDFAGAGFVSVFFAGCDGAPRLGAAVISAFSANSFTYIRIGWRRKSLFKHGRSISHIYKYMLHLYHL
jgi:hypothetical protein